MFSRLLPPLALAALASAATAAAAPSDRHPGVYQFRPIDPAVCASRERQKGPPKPVRSQRLGDLPAAYVIRLGGPLATALRGEAPAQPTYDPCAGIERVR
jgi:hypothetical protein